MPVENLKTEINPDKEKTSPEQKKEFTDEEKRILNKSFVTYDNTTIEKETKKTGDDVGLDFSHFFEDNYKSISKNPEKYPTLYQSLQTFLVNNGQTTANMFTKNINAMEGKFSTTEIALATETYNSPAMLRWLNKNPEKNKREAWEYFHNLLGDIALTWIDQGKREQFSQYPNMTGWVVKELYYAADQNIQTNAITDVTQKQLSIVNALLSSISKENPKLYKEYETIHINTKNHLLTIANVKTITNLTIDTESIPSYKQALTDFTTIAKQKTIDSDTLKESVTKIQPILSAIYEGGLSKYVQAKEETDPLKKIT